MVRTPHCGYFLAQGAASQCHDDIYFRCRKSQPALRCECCSEPPCVPQQALADEYSQVLTLTLAERQAERSILLPLSSLLARRDAWKLRSQLECASAT
mmetsp:Transcript_13385/g.28325  ORF Transcript_13385/g.28325 Transcript_13385/m.28325 type:complete len:98 (-) Transcript_13385:875-1168(-)